MEYISSKIDQFSVDLLKNQLFITVCILKVPMDYVLLGYFLVILFHKYISLGIIRM